MIMRNKVLIVEDEGILSMEMSQSLTSMGYEVIDVAVTGENAVELVDEKRPDLVLMDIQLAGELDGIQAAEMINSRHNIPIIYISGHTDELTFSRAKITGPYAYISKNFNYDELHTTIEMAIYKNELQRKVVENEYLLNITLENILDAVITIDRDGWIQYMNDAAQDLLSVKKNVATRGKIDRLGIVMIDRKGRELVHPYIKKRSRKLGTEEYTLINIAAQRKTVVECTVNILQDAWKNVKGYVYLIRNIEERKKTDAIMSRLASIVESSRDAIIGIDVNGKINSWNAGAEKILGYSSSETIGQNISLLTPDDYPNELPEKIELLRTGETVMHYEGVRQCKNGELIHMSILPSPIKNKKGEMTGISFIARDITEGKQLQKEVMEISEKERERIGQDLHDSLGQQLTGILLNVKAIENRVKSGSDNDVLESITQTEELIKSTIKQTRNMAKTLVPLKLQSEGLPHALGDLVNYAESVYTRKIETVIDYEIDNVNIIAETQIYHIAQEALNNAIKHSGADIISLNLETAQSEIILTVSDNGRGMNNIKSEGLGLGIMKYRAGLINGNISFYGEEGKGTAVVCRIPIQETEKKDG